MSFRSRYAPWFRIPHGFNIISPVPLADYIPNACPRCHGVGEVGWLVDRHEVVAVLLCPLCKRQAPSDVARATL